MLNGLDLFSGIGGLTLALSEWVRPLAYCEQDRYCQAVLLNRMHEGLLPRAPIWDDIRTFRAGQFAAIDIIYGGFPCQDISCAGARQGLEGKRSILFFEVVRLAEEVRPSFIFLENVSAIKKTVPRIRAEFERLSYQVRDGFISASDVGAPHIRDRWFLLAYLNSKRGGIEQELEQQKQTRKLNNPCKGTTWEDVKPPFCGVDYGFSRRVDRIRGLGNAVVPQCAKEAFKILMGIKGVKQAA